MMDKAYALGIDLGGTTIKFGVCDDSGTILLESRHPTRADSPAATIIEDLRAVIDEARDLAAKQGVVPTVVGMGTPGSIDVERGFLVGTTPNFTHWQNVDIRTPLESHSGLKVYIENDANVMAFGEAKFGACKGSLNNVCITIGTGIGGGIIIDGRVFRGSSYCGAELGHMSISYNGRPCKCGNIGCWEQYASATAMINAYNEINSKESVSDTRDIFARFHAGEAVAIEIVEQEISLVSVGLASLVNIFNPNKIVIGGGVSEAGSWFIERIEAEIHKLIPGAAGKDLAVAPAKLGNKAGWLGAAAFAFSESGVQTN